MHWEVINKETENHQIIILSNKWIVMTSGWFSIGISFFGFLLIGYYFSNDFQVRMFFFENIVPWSILLVIFFCFAFLKKRVIIYNVEHLIIKKVGIFSRKIVLPINNIDHLLLEIKCVDWIGKTRATGTTKYDFFKISVVLEDETHIKIISMNSLSSEFGPWKPKAIRELEKFFNFFHIPILGEKSYY